MSAIVAGCGQLIGVDEYRVTDCPPGKALQAGRCITIPSCASGAVPDGKGQCESAGVDDCGADFESDGQGSCFARGGPRGCEGLEITLPDSATCLSAPCSDPALSTPGAGRGWRGVTVDPRAPPGAPLTFRTISAALAAYPGEPLGILLAGRADAPTVVEDRITIDRPVDMLGLCPQAVELRPPPSAGQSLPVISFVSGSDGSSLAGVSLAGGLRVEGVKTISLVRVALRNLDGPGISIESSSQVELTNVVVDGAQGDGVLIIGSDVVISRSNVRDVELLPYGEGGVGIHVRSSRTFPGVDPWAVAQKSTVSIDASVIERVRGAGVLVEGSTVNVTKSVIRDIGPDAWGAGRGVDARMSRIELEPSTVTVDQSVIERTFDAGIRADGAKVTITRTTIRNVGPESGPLDLPPGMESHVRTPACLGAGIRARSNLLREPPADPDVTLEHSSVTGTREAAVVGEGVKIAADHAILGGARSTCDGRGGDGIALYGSEALPAKGDIVHTRVQKTERASVAAFGAKVTVKDSWLENSGADFLARSRGELTTTSSFCRSDGATSPCPPPVNSVTPSLLGWGGCSDSDAVQCESWCFGKFVSDATGGDTAIPGMSGWALHRDDVTTIVTNSDGCVVDFPLPVGERIATVTQGGDCADTATVGPCPPAVGISVSDGAFSPDGRYLGIAAVSFWYGSSPHPPGKPIALSAFLCDVTEVAAAPWRYCGRFGGLAHALLDLDGKDPDYYNNATGFIVSPNSPDQIGTSSVASVTFFDVTSGIHVLHVRPASDAGYAAVDCTLNGPGGTGGYTGWRQIDATTFEVMALPDMVNLGARLWCTRR